MIPLLLTTLFALATCTSNTPISTEQLATFTGFAENLALRPNGNILLTSLTTPSIYHINPSHPNTTTSLPPIPHANGVGGIVELHPDTFAVAAGLWNVSSRRETNASVWTINFAHTPPALKKIVSIPETTVLNGLTSIPSTRLVLASDSALGAIYAIDTVHNSYTLAIHDAVLAPTGPAPALGVNGIKVHGSHLYFANSGTGVFGRFPIAKTGRATGPPETVARFNGSLFSAIDDFDIDEEGDAYVAFHPNTVYRVGVRGGVEVVVGGEGILDPTSVVVGRGRRGGKGEGKGKGKGGKTLYASVNDLEAGIGGVAAIYL